MPSATSNDLEQRVLLVAPTNRDAQVTQNVLAQVGLACVDCRDLRELNTELAAGAAAVVLTEAAILSRGINELLATLDNQPAWSDVPIVLLLRGGVQSPAAIKVLKSLRNVTLLELPASIRSVVSAIEAAVRGRQRQYQIREQIEAIRQAEIAARELQESERAARTEAERISRVKDEFLATLSHELRTPLSAIFGWAQILKMGKNDAATVAEGIDVIDRNVRAQTHLIEDLLDMSRIMSGKVRLDVQVVELVEVVTSAIEAVLPAINAKGIRLERVLDPRLGPVSGDPARLQQVLWNLLTNAIKFTPKGGRIQVVAQRVDSHIEVSVTDTGEGISPDFLPRLFDRFSQEDSSTKRRHGGLGLGLSIVKSLVELHGGQITARSAGLGQGATFTVQLPLRIVNRAEGPATQPRTLLAAGDPTRELPALQGLKVLVVDDEGDARELVRRCLVECQAIPALAASADEAESILTTFQPDLILSDIGMPERDGYEFMRAVRTRGLKTPAVALTAFARAEDRIRAIQAGYQTHLTKPVEPAELMAVIARLSGA